MYIYKHTSNPWESNHRDGPTGHKNNNNNQPPWLRKIIISHHGLGKYTISHPGLEI